MKCPHCNEEHPDSYKFCPVMGKEIEPQLKACANKDCPDCGKFILPLEAKFCPRCGHPIQARKEGINRQEKRKPNPETSRIVVICSEAGSYIQIGKCKNSHTGEREKRLKLNKGENIISVKEHPELKFGFSFADGDRPEHVKNIILDNFDTSNVTYMSCMFYGCSSLKSLDLDGFDTSNVTDMSFMFDGCNSLEFFDLSSFDTSNVTDMTFMFGSCNLLNSIDLSNFNTINVTDMVGMFSNCCTLQELDLRNFNTTNVQLMTWMFENCSLLESLNLNGFNTISVRSMDEMFFGCNSLKSLDLSNFDTSSVIDMKGMFDGCSKEIQEKYKYLTIK